MSDNETDHDDRSVDAEGLVIPTAAEIAEQLEHYAGAEHSDADAEPIEGSEVTS